MHNPVDRIGIRRLFKSCLQILKFVDYIEHVTDEFREIYDIVKHTKPYTGLKVAILNAWGRLTWQHTWLPMNFHTNKSILTLGLWP